MKISEILKDLRENSNLTQKELAQKMGIGQSTISSYENELMEPAARALILYANFFNVSVDYILDREQTYTAPALSEDEKELLNIFSSLSDSGKDTVMVAARNAARFENKGSIHKRA